MSERQRQRDLDTYRIVDSLPEAAYDDIVRIAARLCDAPIATMSLIDRDRQWFKSRVGIESMETARDVAFCDHAVREPQLLLEVTDATQDARFRDNPDVAGGLGIRFYAGMPLVTPNGTAVGTVCVIDRRPRELDDGQRDALAALARITMNLLESRRQLLDAERTALLHAPADGVAHDAPSQSPSRYSVVIVELQGYARVVSQRGHRVVEQTLQQCSQALERLLAPGEALNRVSGAPEFVLTLNGDVDAERMQAIERVANASATILGTDAIAAMATSASASENPLQVFGRADEDLTRRKTERIDLSSATVESAALVRH